jgi:hypothetical protein
MFNMGCFTYTDPSTNFMMKRNQPLTLEELREIADEWFPLFDEVHNRLPEWASVEDTLKVMDNLSKIAGAKVIEQERKDRDFFYYRGSLEPLHQD